ncbi:MAG: DUF2520 domain-containing protein [Actinomycetia bacterium]|nr:DUF2520 domain-containing protein [Actinomycetes bacterium]
MQVRIVGLGRAGGALADALAARGTGVDSWPRNQSVAEAAAGVDLLILAVPDDTIAEVAQAVDPDSDTVVAHLAGSRTLEVLTGHSRRASLHPLASLPDRQRGAERLLDGCTFAVAGDPLVEEVVAVLGGRVLPVADPDRVAYHAAAAIAANHLVAVLAQVERVATSIGLPFDAFRGLIDGVLTNVDEVGPAAALSGPAARGDRGTIEAHLAALAPSERALYLECARAAAGLTGRRSALDGLEVDPQ